MKTPEQLFYPSGSSLPKGDFVPIVNNDDELQGYMIQANAHKYNQQDRIAAVMLLTPDNQGVFLQQRAPHKKIFPNALTLAATGHVEYNHERKEPESYLEAAQREFREELGLPCPPLLEIGKYHIDAGHHGMYQMFQGMHDGNPADFSPKPEEVSQVLLVARRKLGNLADQFTPPSRRLLERIGYL